MWWIAPFVVFEVAALAALIDAGRRPAEAFPGGEVGRARWRRRLVLAAATGWLVVGALVAAAYWWLVVRLDPDAEGPLEEASQRVRVQAAPGECLAVLLDFERYPEWSEAETATVLERDTEGRGRRVRFERQSPMGLFAYTMVYDYSEEPLAVVATVAEVDAAADAGMDSMMGSMASSYRLEPVGDETLIAYDLSLRLPATVPKFMAGRMASMMSARTTEALKTRVESMAARAQSAWLISSGHAEEPAG